MKRRCGKGRGTWRKWRLTLACGLTLALTCAGTPRPRGTYFSSACASDSVAFSLQEVDSLTTALDSGETQIRLLRVELDQCREVSRLDSLAAAARLADEKQSWWEKAARHPLVWFVLGAYVTSQIERI